MSPGVPECRKELVPLWVEITETVRPPAELEGHGQLVPLLQAVVLVLQDKILYTRAIHIYNHQGKGTGMHTS